MLVSGLALGPLAVAYVVVPMPSGRRRREPATPRRPTAPSATPDRRPLLAGPLLLLGLAIAAYVAAEVGVSNWLVRFLEPAPLTTATLALSLYWAGIAIGRLVSSVIADRFDHLRFTADQRRGHGRDHRRRRARAVAARCRSCCSCSRASRPGRSSR